jgi:hypothetical protein
MVAMAERRALITYDPRSRRVWIGGQRLHHGVTGIVLAGAGLAGFPGRRRRGLPFALFGSALIAHDWKDRAVWFRRERPA